MSGMEAMGRSPLKRETNSGSCDSCNKLGNGLGVVTVVQFSAIFLNIYATLIVSCIAP